MKDLHDIEHLLMEMDIPFERVQEDLWVLSIEPWDLPVMVKYEPPFLEIMLSVGKIPATKREEFFRYLLEQNASGMIYVAYGILDDKVVITGSLMLETLNAKELHSVLDSITMQLQLHYKDLKRFYE